ncbi:MAG: DUF1810 domain-containing protein [Myxococcota bacterium]|jgi:uncharacterized protein (DUF1810 family)|nr:DUF1810 domain-containing protein [Myxococcota bacterium]
MHGDQFHLARFLTAQDGVYASVVKELREGTKTSHWMWFVFPQVRGLGKSATAERFALSGVDEAVAYVGHPVLGARLRECVEIVNGLRGLSALQVFGTPDDLKFRSSMTLFAVAAPNERLFREALSRYYGGEPDQRTLSLVGKAWEPG